MPAGSRVRNNNVYGSITDAPLTAGALIFNSSQLNRLEAISGEHAVITLDPLRQHGEPEIIVVTSHSAMATVATITRGAYNTTPRSHPEGTIWVHSAIDEDFTEIVTAATRPADPYRGQKIFETDTNRFVARSQTDVWQQDGLFFDPPYVSAYRTAALSHTATGAWQAFAFDTELNDPTGMHDNATNNSRFTIAVPGVYQINMGVIFANATNGLRALGFRMNGVGTGPNLPGREQLDVSGLGLGGAMGINVSILHYFPNVGDYVEAMIFQSSGGNLAYTIITAERANYLNMCWIGRGL